jgi:hypothetical protein
VGKQRVTPAFGCASDPDSRRKQRRKPGRIWRQTAGVASPEASPLWRGVAVAVARLDHMMVACQPWPTGRPC